MNNVCKKLLSCLLISATAIVISCGTACCANIGNMKASVVRVVVTGVFGNRRVLGSAFAVGEGDTYVTNWHVVDLVKWGGEINIVNDAGKLMSCSLIDKDTEKDIAIIRSDASYKKKPVLFCKASDIVVGDDVYAMGFPGAADFEDRAPKGSQGITVTKGIISKISKYKHRTYVQTDAAINPGNSGGPLFSSSGYVVAINTFKPRQSQDEDMNVEGVGWSLQSTEIHEILKKNNISIAYYDGSNSDSNSYADNTPADDTDGDDEETNDTTFGFDLWNIAIVISSILAIALAGSVVVLFLKRQKQKCAIIAVKGDYKGTCITAERCFSVGRGAQCLIAFPQRCSDISREHFTITYDKKNKRYAITDLSVNGTFVNGKRLVKFQPHLLKDSDFIALGIGDVQILKFRIL